MRRGPWTRLPCPPLNLTRGRKPGPPRFGRYSAWQHDSKIIVLVQEKVFIKRVGRRVLRWAVYQQRGDVYVLKGHYHKISTAKGIGLLLIQETTVTF